MTSRDFCYWLQGHFEISGSTNLTEKQVEVIRNHLNMVFKHEIDPSHGDAAHQKVLSDVHKGAQPTTQPTGQTIGGTQGIPGAIVGIGYPFTTVNC